MIRLFIGTPGAGKSYAALKDVVEELAYGSRLIVTNLPVLTGELNAWMAKEHPLWKDDINQRIRLISEEETKQFYRYRAIAGDLGTVSKEDSLAGRHLPYGEHRGAGVLYVIDEAHIPFDSREWASTGPELTYYNSQHRKLGDELVFITQFEKLIDVRVRGFVQEFCYFNNNGLEKFMTWFQKPATFSMEVHRKPPSGPGSPAPLESRTYRMDFALAKCYDTSAGVGIVGRKLPERKRKKAIPIWWLAVPIILAGIIIAKIPGWMGKGAGYWLRGGQETIEQKVAQATGATSARGEEQRQPQRETPDVPRGTTVKVPTAEPLHATGYILSPRRGMLVTLSDGTRKSTAPGVVEAITIKGERYALKPQKREEMRLTPVQNGPNVVSHENKQPDSQPRGDP